MSKVSFDQAPERSNRTHLLRSTSLTKHILTIWRFFYSRYDFLVWKFPRNAKSVKKLLDLPSPFVVGKSRIEFFTLHTSNTFAHMGRDPVWGKVHVQYALLWRRIQLGLSETVHKKPLRSYLHRSSVSYQELWELWGTYRNYQELRGATGSFRSLRAFRNFQELPRTSRSF